MQIKKLNIINQFNTRNSRHLKINSFKKHSTGTINHQKPLLNVSELSIINTINMNSINP